MRWFAETSSDFRPHAMLPLLSTTKSAKVIQHESEKLQAAVCVVRQDGFEDAKLLKEVLQ
jgi:hypothetical protein